MIDDGLREMIDNIVARDKSALTSFYRRFGSQQYGLALKILQDKDLAQEALQELYIDFWQNASGYRQMADPVLALLQNCRNIAIRMLRNRGIVRKRDAVIDRKKIGDLRDEMAKFIQEDAAQNEKRWVMKRALEIVPIDQRLLIEMAYFDGLTVAELADKLKRSNDVIREKLTRGIDKLASSLIVD